MPYSEMTTTELEEWRREFAANEDWVAVDEITSVLKKRKVQESQPTPA